MQIMKLLMMTKNRKYLFSCFTLIFFLLSCNGNEHNSKWHEAQKYYNAKDFDNCSVILNELVYAKNNNYSPKALFLLSEMYLNEFEEYLISIEFLNQIIEDYPNNDLAKRALFTKAYIYANYLDLYSDAIILYNDFIANYPNDDLISSVEYELNELKDYENKIKNLINSN